MSLKLVPVMIVWLVVWPVLMPPKELFVIPVLLVSLRQVVTPVSLVILLVLLVE